jgi:DNA (cytosine-5)-methyltransferase 1
VGGGDIGIVPKRRSKRSRPLRSFDFFCGIGGLTRGLSGAGIRVLAGFDVDEECRLTYEKNNPGVKFIRKDIRKVTVAELKRMARVKSFKNMLFAGCAPCSPFSQKRKAETPSGDLTLLMAFGQIISKAKPGYVLVENVPGIANARGYSTFRRFVRLLENSGYKHRIEYDILDAKRFGVPQTRRRLVLIATRKARPSLPTPKYGTEHRPFKTVRQTIDRFPILRAGSRHKKIKNHAASAISPLNLDRLRATPPDGGDWRDWPEELRLQCHLGDGQAYSDSYGRMSWDSPAPTLTGRCHSISNGRYGHPTQCRAISLREAAALQTFPNSYEFFGLHTHIAQQIGNAVPVRLAKELGKHILQLRDQHRHSCHQRRKAAR